MSKLYPCPDCGTQVSRNANVCPKCGRQLNSPENIAKGIGSLIGLATTIWLFWKFGVFKTLWAML
ncbi:MAG: zinc-ribbon domain-containing protein [Kiritimatiellae bacterium]|nr:zinc-ribbon domain-containing protein [Kiritimatiellia bacterium]